MLKTGMPAKRKKSVTLPRKIRSITLPMAPPASKLKLSGSFLRFKRHQLEKASAIIIKTQLKPVPMYPIHSETDSS